MSTKKRKCSVSPLRAPSVHKKAYRIGASSAIKEAHLLLESAEWYEKYMAASEFVGDGSVWEMMKNLDENLDVPDFFDNYNHDAPKFMSIVERIRTIFATEDCKGYDQAGWEVFKFIPATPEMTAIFTKAYQNWMGEGCDCSPHFERMQRQMPGFWHLIDEDERVVKLSKLVTEKK